jgi:hypothetical protein
MNYVTLDVLWCPDANDERIQGRKSHANASVQFLWAAKVDDVVLQALPTAFLCRLCGRRLHQLYMSERVSGCREGGGLTLKISTNGGGMTINHGITSPIGNESRTQAGTVIVEDDHVVIAGWGSCKSCDCRGYIRKKPDICECGHHFSQHG